MGLVTAVLSVVMLGSTSGVSAKVAPAQSRRKAPTFVLSDANGSPVRLSDYKEKVVVLDFWATWCTGSPVTPRRWRSSSTSPDCPSRC
jgi:thiol-disulfide isomerase/thioredoxin